MAIPKLAKRGRSVRTCGRLKPRLSAKKHSVAASMKQAEVSW